MKVYIDIEEAWQFWMTPNYSASERARDKPRAEQDVVDIEIDAELYAKYQEVFRQAQTAREHLEHMYRHQMKLPPYEDSPYYDEDKHIQRGPRQPST